jgi:hypothetical protein
MIDFKFHAKNDLCKKILLFAVMESINIVKCYILYLFFPIMHLICFKTKQNDYLLRVKTIYPKEKLKLMIEAL